MSAPVAEFLEAPDLLRFAPVSISVGPDPSTHDHFELCAEDVALRLFPRILPARGGQLELLVADYQHAVSGNEFVREAVALCEPGWLAYFAGRTIEIYAHGVKVRGRGGSWSVEILESTARMLSIAKRPSGVIIPEPEVALAAATLLRLARQTREVEERSRPGGRPTVGPVLFDILEHPFPDVTKADRARLASGLLASLAGIDVTAQSILDAKKAAAARNRQRARASSG